VGRSWSGARQSVSTSAAAEAGAPRSAAIGDVVDDAFQRMMCGVVAHGLGLSETHFTVASAQTLWYSMMK
jgi:hypothetical protein